MTLEFSNTARKAEFIRDVLSLANFGPHSGTEHAYLVVGVKNREVRDITDQRLDGSTLQALVDAYISPGLSVHYEELPVKRNKRVGVLVIMPEQGRIYAVKKELRENERIHLAPGQAWSRRGSAKALMSGEDIWARIEEIISQEVERAREPLLDRISELESISGPVMDIRRIRFQLEATTDWDSMPELLLRLIPYAREFGHRERGEIVSTVHEVTSRTRQGLTEPVAEAVAAVLIQTFPIHNLVSPTKNISGEDLELLDRAEHPVFCLAWDACRYLRDVGVLKHAAHLYTWLIRYTALNEIAPLRDKFLENARQCAERCDESRHGVTFSEGKAILEEQIAFALEEAQYGLSKYKAK